MLVLPALLTLQLPGLKEHSHSTLPLDEFPAWWKGDKYTSATLLSKAAPLNPLLLQIQGNAPFFDSHTAAPLAVCECTSSCLNRPFITKVGNA